MDKKLKDRLLDKLANWKCKLESDEYFLVDIIFNIYSENHIDLDIYLDRSDIKSNIFLITKLDSSRNWYDKDLTDILDKVERKLNETTICV